MLGLRWADAAFPSAQDTGECTERSRSVSVPRGLVRGRVTYGFIPVLRGRYLWVIRELGGHLGRFGVVHAMFFSIFFHTNVNRPARDS
eukprot:391477-Prymnesium_polylepis.1